MLMKHPYFNPRPASRLLTTLNEKALENIKGKGENVGSQHFFSFFHNVFYSSQKKFHFLIHISFVICKCFQFGAV